MENNEIMNYEEVEVMDNDIVEVDEETGGGSVLGTVLVAGIAFGAGWAANKAVKLAKKGITAVKAKHEAKKESKKNKNDNVVDVDPKDIEEVVDEETAEK